LPHHRRAVDETARGQRCGSPRSVRRKCATTATVAADTGFVAVVDVERTVPWNHSPPLSGEPVHRSGGSLGDRGGLTVDRGERLFGFVGRVDDVKRRIPPTAKAVGFLLVFL
jgi:hypothetical protein